MSPHIYFISPEKKSPTGGMNVIFQFARMLADRGHSVSVHYQSPDFAYEYGDPGVPTTYSPYEKRSERRLSRIKRRLRNAFGGGARNKPQLNRLSRPAAGDLVVLPDFWAADQLARFPGIPKVVLAQDVGGSIWGTLLPMSRRRLSDPGLKGFVTTSRAADDAIATFSDLPRWHVPLYLDGDVFGFRPEKKRQICFIDRKRESEVATMHEFLGRDLAGRGIDLVKIKNVPTEELVRTISESLFFLSFSQREGFGLPPAEAMATGSIVIGYAGVGGNEYFTPETGFPVPDDDLIAFYRRVIRIVEDYDRDPAPYEELRRNASRKILGTYRRDRTEQALLEGFGDILSRI